jgi:hypothetical protein
MVLGYSNLDRFVYGCFVEKEKSKIKPPFWWLKGREIQVQGADVYDEICDIAFGDSPEELLVWAKVHGFDIASDAESLIE